MGKEVYQPGQSPHERANAIRRNLTAAQAQQHTVVTTTGGKINHTATTPSQVSPPSIVLPVPSIVLPVPTGVGGTGADLSSGVGYLKIGTAGTAASLQSTPLPAGDIPNLDASKITTGTLATARGGLALDGSAAGNGKVPIGNGSGYTLANITAGSNVTITNGAGSITIAAAAGTATLAGQLAIALMDGQSPAFIGGQMAEIIMPYDTAGASLTWSLDNFVWSMGVAGSTQSQILFEKSTGTGVFSASPTQSSTYSLTSGTLTQTGISGFTFASGDKLRLNIVAIGTATQNWKIWAQFTSGGTAQKMIVQCVVGGWTPSATGADANEFVLPFGTFGDSRMYTLQQVLHRNRRAGAGTSTYYFQNTQTVASGFTNVPGISALFTMTASGFEFTSTAPGAFYAASGDKYRLNVQSLSVLSMYWTLILVWTYN